MSGAAEQANFPTMIIPRGTEIKVNANGQLSIKTPGNLVIQNSGTYSDIESTNGSIRIEENVTVEAVSIRAGQACFIQGTLTAWRVHAKRITREVLYALRERNVTRVGGIYRGAFSELKTQSEGVRQAYEHLDKYFQR